VKRRRQTAPAHGPSCRSRLPARAMRPLQLGHRGRADLARRPARRPGGEGVRRTEGRPLRDLGRQVEPLGDPRDRLSNHRQSSSTFPAPEPPTPRSARRPRTCGATSRPRSAPTRPSATRPPPPPRGGRRTCSRPECEKHAGRSSHSARGGRTARPAPPPARWRKRGRRHRARALAARRGRRAWPPRTRRERATPVHSLRRERRLFTT